MGPGKIIGAVTQMLTAPLCFILRVSVFFILCGTMFPRNLSNAGDVAASHASDAIAERRSSGLGSMQSSSRHVR